MKISRGETIRKMRKDMGFTQEEFAEELGISVSNLSRIENGKLDVNIWEFVSILEMYGDPTEDFWLMYIDSKEYEHYCVYRDIKRHLRDREYGKAREAVEMLEMGSLSKYSYMKQFLALAKAVTDTTLSVDDLLKELESALYISKPHFEWSSLLRYRLNYNEINIISIIASKLFAQGEIQRAIEIMENMIVNRVNSLTTIEDRSTLFPAMMFTLSNMYGKSDNHEMALTYCEEALKNSRAYGNMRYIPAILYNMASAYDKLGFGKNIQSAYLEQAYHSALAMGEYDDAKIIKDDAEESFGIILSSDDILWMFTENNSRVPNLT